MQCLSVFFVLLCFRFWFWFDFALTLTTLGLPSVVLFVMLLVFVICGYGFLLCSCLDCFVVVGFWFGVFWVDVLRFCCLFAVWLVCNFGLNLQLCICWVVFLLADGSCRLVWVFTVSGFVIFTSRGCWCLGLYLVYSTGGDLCLLL